MHLCHHRGASVIGMRRVDVSVVERGKEFWVAVRPICINS